MRTIDKPTHCYNLRSRGGVDRKAKNQPKRPQKAKKQQKTKAKPPKIAVRKTSKESKTSKVPEPIVTVSSQKAVNQDVITYIQPRQDISAPECLFDIKTCHLKNDFDLETLMGQDDLERMMQAHSLFDELISGPDSCDFLY